MATDIVQTLRIKVDIKKGLVQKAQNTILMMGDKDANRIIAELYDGDTPVTLSGVTVTGKFIRPPDGAEISLTGTANGNEASVLLIDKCYENEGQYEANVILKSGSTERTILSVTGDVHRSGSGAYVDVSNVIPSIDDIVAQYAEMQRVTQETEAAKEDAQDAVEAANDAVRTSQTAVANANAAIAKVDGMTVSATGGTTANATISEQGGVKHIDFVLPKGDKGDKGDPGSIDNVTITSIAGLEEALASKQPAGSYVKTVDGKAPTSNGNVALGAVQSVNGTAPDASGNVDLVVGTVKSVNSILPGENGDVDLGALANSVAFNGSVLELQIMSGVVTLENVAAGKTASRKIRFNIPFNSTPAVVATVSASLPRDRFVGVYNTTATEVTLYGANGSDDTMNIPIRWMAIGAIGDTSLNPGGGGSETVTEE